MTKLYQEIARCVEARAHCMRNNLPAPRQAHTDRIARMVREHMPSGSGVDDGTALDFDRSTGERLVFICNYHHMNEHGVYDGWTEHTVIVRASLTRDFTLHVTGRDRNDIKAYLGELYHEALSAEVCRHSNLTARHCDLCYEEMADTVPAMVSP